MKKNYHFFVGVDVSKNHIAYDIIEDGNIWQEGGGLANNRKGWRELIGIVCNKTIGTNHKALFCMKKTRVYGMAVCDHLRNAGFDCQVVASGEIRLSKGPLWNDHRISAGDIAEYVFEVVYGKKVVYGKWVLNEMPEGDDISG
jgi:transposase